VSRSPRNPTAGHARGYFTTELLIGVSIATLLAVAVVQRAGTAERAATADRLAQQLLGAAEAARQVYAGQADFTGLNAALIAVRVPAEMVVRDAGGTPMGLVNATGGPIGLRAADNPTTAWIDTGVLDTGDRPLCATLLARLVPLFRQVDFTNAGAASGTALGPAATLPTLHALCAAGQGAYSLSLAFD
jgi:type II secretory pathway pseudopilin PulG